MRTAIRKNLADFLAILGVVVLGLGIGAYILSNQRLRFPLIEDKPYTVRPSCRTRRRSRPARARRSSWPACAWATSARWSSRTARRSWSSSSSRSTAASCGRTPPRCCARRPAPRTCSSRSTRRGQAAPDGGRIKVSNTLPDVDPDEFLAALDADTREYLKLLISGAGKGLEGRGTDLREVLKRLGPLHRDLARVSRAVAERRTTCAGW